MRRHDLSNAESSYFQKISEQFRQTACQNAIGVAREAIVRKLTYQNGLSILLGITFGIVLFDRGAINFLAPLIVADLKLTNAQLGIAASVVALTSAIAGCIVGRISDVSGRRKPY